MLSRRQILKAAAATAAVMATPLSAWPAPERGRVVVAREADRARAVAACLDALEFRACEGRGVAVKANFNSEDAFPASTHPDTLAALFATRLPGDGHDYMQELHRSPHQRAMIAEANLTWRPTLNVMDALEAFVDGGPEAGTRAAPGVFLASDDRCALDAAAIALLREHGMKGPAASGLIARTEQLARALALGLGAAPTTVEVVPASPEIGRAHV